MINKNFKENACILPWICLSISGGNDISICCSTKSNFGKIDNKSQLKDIWKGKNFTDARDSFLNGKIPKVCLSCRDREQVGLRSRRIRFKDWVYDYFDIVNLPKLQYLDINFSNLCNLNCAMCNSKFSSSWIKYDKEFINEGLEFRNHAKNYLKIERIPKSFLEQINIEDLKFIEIKGGEPLIDDRFIYFLDKLINKKNYAHTHITTNLTILKPEVLKKIQKLHIFSMDVSIDGTGDIYKFIRGNEASLNKVEINLHKIIECNNLHKLRINITTSPYNLWDSYKIVDFIKNISPKIYINWCPITVYPEYLIPLIIPYSLRKESVEKLSELLNKEDNKHIIDLKETINYLNKRSQNISDEQRIYRENCFIRWTNKLVEIRKIDIYEVIPQLKKFKEMKENNRC